MRPARSRRMIGTAFNTSVDQRADDMHRQRPIALGRFHEYSSEHPPDSHSHQMQHVRRRTSDVASRLDQAVREKERPAERQKTAWLWIRSQVCAHEVLVSVSGVRQLVPD